MTKLLWHSNVPWAPTGYGQQTGLFTPRLRDLGYDVAISACWGLGGDRIEWDGMTVYPADDNWGNRSLATVSKMHGGDEDCLIITLLDVWPLTADSLAEVPIASWCPVDHAPVPPRVAGFFERTGARPIAMSQFGQQMLRNAGLDPLYVPHGIDTAVFQPRDSRARTRERMGDIPDEAFVVGMVANNKGTAPPRKAYPQVFMAFSYFLKTHPDVDAYLYLHSEMSGVNGGINLAKLAEACQIPPERIKFTPPVAYEFGIEPEALSHLYSAMDVLAHPSYGEGFGIPIIESQACGTPVIVTDWTAMTELCGAGWRVDGDPWYDASQGSFYKSPSVEEIHTALVHAYRMPAEQRAEMRAQAREFAIGYDADVVTDAHWKPVLEELTSIPKPATKPAPEVLRRPNRAERRAAARRKEAA